ncbi:ATP synthase F1 [Fusarium circinatum]|uniref:ATP synthase F1 n=1 Tax=Fusarium circinatum TaxID=48490 RepID=A0A8H5WVG4_FUSCI|nr:ATP synthase F1 [Fusarium circinatum]
MSTSTAQSIFGRWSLASVDNKPAADILRIGASADGIETALVDDSRIPVQISDIRPGGKYYSIVKLQIKFEKQLSSDNRWAQGTGWLIASDLVITAGHCTYDHTYNFGKAVKIRAYIGYNGKHVTPINYNPTAAAFKDWKLGVVGYPDDKTLDDEPGAQMYEMFKETTCDLSKTSLNMLEHTISFGPGQSGSPVLIDGQNMSIGTNVYGLGTSNSASVIRGEYGNYYKSMVDALSSTEAPVTTRNGVEYIKTTQPEDAITNEPAGDEESFWGCVNNVVNIGAKSTSLSVIGKLTSGKTEDAFDDKLGPPALTTADYKYHASRAILGEAALQTFLKMGPRQTHKYDMISKMQARYKKAHYLVPHVATLIAPAVTEPALRIAVDSQASDNAPKTYPTMPPTEDAFDSPIQPFVDGLMKSVHNQEEQEDFFGFLSGIAKTAANVVSTDAPIISAVGSIADAIGGGAEDSFEPDSGDLALHVEVLCHRALLGDAALYALMTVPTKDIQEERFFGDLIDTVKNIGSTVIKVAPTVIKTITPIVQNLGNHQVTDLGGEDSRPMIPSLLAPSGSASGIHEAASQTQRQSKATRLSTEILISTHRWLSRHVLRQEKNPDPGGQPNRSDQAKTADDYWAEADKILNSLTNILEERPTAGDPSKRVDTAFGG